MTATDFQALAATIAGARALADDFMHDAQHDGYADGIRDATEIVAANVARHCAERNHRFDRARFMAACGIDVEHLAVPTNHHEVNA